MQASVQLALTPNLCSIELVKSGDKTKQSGGKRFGVILLLPKLFLLSVSSQYGEKEHFRTFHQVLLVKLK